MKHPGKTLLEGVAQLQQSGAYSDLTVTCGVATFKVHRSILCSQSGFFQAACKEGFAEGDTGLVDLQEDTEELVRSMIGYLYTMNFAVDHLDNIKDERSHNCTHKRGFHSYNNDTCFLAPYAFIVDMYTLGDKYDIPGLRAKACAHLKELFDLDPLRDWEHEIAVWEYTYQHSRKTDELRALLVNKITTDFVQHLLGESERFYPFVLRCPELTDALLKAAHEKMNDLTGPKALGC